MLPTPDHPIAWRKAVTPADVVEGTVVGVPGGAIAARVRADALVSVGYTETRRRGDMGLKGVGSLQLLDVLLGLPLLHPISIDDLTQRERRILGAAPKGCVELYEDYVVRTIQMPMTVVAAVIRGSSWRAALRRMATFSPFAQCIVVLPALPGQEAILEAQLTGVGIWVGRSSSLEECLPPKPFLPKYVKAAGWRFSEHAFAKAAELGLLRLDGRLSTTLSSDICC